MKLTFRLLFVTGFIASASSASAQKKILEKLLSSEKDTTRSPSFIPLPAIGYAQETGFEFGLVTLYSFYTDRQDVNTRSSSFSGMATFTTKKQSNFKLNSDIWSPGNTWHNHSELRYKNFPFNFYGTGANTRQADQDVLVQKLFRISHDSEKRLGKSTYAGVNASFENYSFRDREAGGIFGGSVSGKTGGKVFFIGASSILDNRNTNTYTTKGSYIKFNYSFAPGFFDASDFNGELIKAEAKHFLPVSKNTTLGLQMVVQSIDGDDVPFYLLPQLGNDQVMRAYYTGRYRDNNLLATQMELRYRFIPRLGIAAFIGAGNVAGNAGDLLENLKPSYGAGGRYFFDVERGLSIRVDYSQGEKRPGEKRQSGFYISLGEAF